MTTKLFLRVRTCDGALSKRLEYGPGSGSARGTLLAGLRYEYDGLNVLRVDELYDNDSNGLETNDAWRAREANAHRPLSFESGWFIPARMPRPH